MANDKTIHAPQQEATCVVCGTKFVPHGTDQECCSPFCRTMKIAKDRERNAKVAHSAQITQLEKMQKPPKFDLAAHPKARAEWFMSLSPEYKAKFRKFLSAQELEWSRAIAQKMLAEDRFFSGIYVKNGKVVESKSSDVDNENGENEMQEKNNEEVGEDFFDA